MSGRRYPCRCRRDLPGLARGLTLLELVIACGLLALLLSLAIPSYQGYMQRARRAAAIDLLLAAAACQERIHASEFRYDTRRCAQQDGSGSYTLRFKPEGVAGTASYLVIADPQGAQRSDSCGSLSLDQSGLQAIEGPAELQRRCWEGR